MISLRRPLPEQLHHFVQQQSPLPFTYPHVGATGATASTPPAGYVVDRTRIQLGVGDETFQAGVAALRQWSQFQLGWVETFPADIPIEPGATVAVIAHVAGLWWVNACRIVCVIDEPAPTRRFGFAYGTLPDHAESGEERFQIEQTPDGAVWFEILAFSCPRHPLARLFNFWVRRLQKRFGPAAGQAMRQRTSGFPA